MWSLQLLLRDHWDFVDESVILTWTPEIELDLLWWSDARHLLVGVSLVSPQRLGANLQDQFISGRWSVVEQSYSINLRELWAIRLGLFHFGRSLLGRSVGVFSDNTTALSYICKQSGTFLPALNHEALLLLHWAELMEITLVPQFIIGHGK